MPGSLPLGSPLLERHLSFSLQMAHLASQASAHMRPARRGLPDCPLKSFLCPLCLYRIAFSIAFYGLCKKVIFLGHLLDLCGWGFCLLLLCENGDPIGLLHHPFPATHRTASSRDICWKTDESSGGRQEIREASGPSATLKPWLCAGLGRHGLCSAGRMKQPARSGVWGRWASEDRGHRPPSGKAQCRAYSSRCSRECLIVTFSPWPRPMAGDSLIPWSFLTSARGCAFKWLMHAVEFDFQEPYFCCLFLLSFSQRSSLNCPFQGTFRHPSWLTVQQWLWANSLVLRSPLGVGWLRDEARRRRETISLLLLVLELLWVLPVREALGSWLGCKYWCVKGSPRVNELGLQGACW